MSAPAPPRDGGRDVTVRDTREVALVDVLDRLLAGGVVLVGDLTISLAGIDLVRVSLQALITSVREDSAVADTPVADTAEAAPEGGRYDGTDRP